MKNKVYKRFLHAAMPKVIFPSMAMAFLLLIASCSGKSGKETDTLTVEPDPTPELPLETIADAQLTARGIGPVRIHSRIVDLRPKVENLYDSVARESGYESNTYHFYLDGEQRFSVYEFGSGMVDVIGVEDSSVIVRGAGNKTVRLGDPFSKVLELDGVTPQWESADDEGMWVWSWEGIWFVPDQSRLPDTLAHKLYNQNVAPRLSDFTPEVTIGYIGTGLPW